MRRLSLYSAMAVCLWFLSPLPGNAQTEPSAYGSAATLNSNSPSLLLPGSLTLTSVIAAPNGGGVPTGTVSFSYDTSNLLGTGNLAILPATQAFPAAPTTSFPFGTATFAFWAAPFFSAAEMDIAASNINQTGPNQGPVLTIFHALGRGGFSTFTPTMVESFPTGYFIDAIASGDFTHTGSQEFLAHSRAFEAIAPGQYDIINSTLADTTVAVPACAVTDTNCNVNDPDDQSLVVDDFTGDGFADIASLTSSAPSLVETYTSAQTTVQQPNIHIAVNNGNAQALGFTFGANATLPTFPDPTLPTVSDLYCPVAIASGQFRTGGKKDVVSVGTTSVNVPGQINNCTEASSLGYLVLLLGDGAGGLTSQTPVKLGHGPSAVGTGDFNKDGNTDVVVTDAVDNTVEILYGNGDGTFASQTFTITAGNAARTLQIADFNGDGYPDLAISDTGDNTIDLLLNDGTGKLLTPVAVYTPGAVPISILSQDMNGDGLPDLTALVSPPPSLPSAPQATVAVLINSASAQATFTTAPQTLPAGTHTLTTTFPGDANFTTSTSPAVTVTVAQTTPTILWTPPTAIVGGTPLGAAQLDATTSIPGTFTYGPPAGTVLETGTNTLSVSFIPSDTFDYTGAEDSVPITVVPPAPAASATGPQTSDPDTQPAVQLSVAPYALPVTAALTLSFAPTPPNQTGDPAVLFANGTTAEVLDIPANSTATIPPISLQTGSTAGTITVTVQLTAGGANITPPGLAPVAITVPAVAPVVNSAVLTRSGNSMQVVILGFSSPRNMTQAEFHFTPMAGAQLATTDLTVPLTGAFTTWYQNETSTAFGTTFQYTQPFTLDGPATDVQSVTITLTNSQGGSQATTVQ